MPSPAQATGPTGAAPAGRARPGPRRPARATGGRRVRPAAAGNGATAPADEAPPAARRAEARPACGAAARLGAGRDHRPRHACPSCGSATAPTSTSADVSRSTGDLIRDVDYQPSRTPGRPGVRDDRRRCSTRSAHFAINLATARRRRRRCRASPGSSASSAGPTATSWPSPSSPRPSPSWPPPRRPTSSGRSPFFVWAACSTCATAAGPGRPALRPRHRVPQLDGAAHRPVPAGRRLGRPSAGGAA